MCVFPAILSKLSWITQYRAPIFPVHQSGYNSISQILTGNEFDSWKLPQTGISGFSSMVYRLKRSVKYQISIFCLFAHSVTAFQFLSTGASVDRKVFLIAVLKFSSKLYLLGHLNT